MISYISDRLSLLKLALFMFSIDLLFFAAHWIFIADIDFGPLFNLGYENNFPTWYSSFKLFIAAVLAFLCYQQETSATQINFALPSWLWILVALLMAGMSIDETAQLHETASIYFMDSLAGARLRVAIQIGIMGGPLLWGMIFAPVLILIAGGLLSFYYSRMQRRRMLFLFAAISMTLFLCSFLLEQNQANIAGQLSSLQSNDIFQYQLLSSLEELSELFAINFLILIHFGYLKSIKR